MSFHSSLFILFNLQFAQKSRSTLHPVFLNTTKDVKDQIENALKRTSFSTLGNGNMISIPVGNHKFTSDELAENIIEVINQLKDAYPGGLRNMFKVTISISLRGTSAEIIYKSELGPPGEIPVIIGPREKKLIVLNEKANEILKKFEISIKGKIVKRKQS